MKEYTTLEMIEEATKCPGITFESLEDGAKVTYCKSGSYMHLRWHVGNGHDFHITECTLKLKWTKVQQPVSFMDAVKAFNEGKTIKCEYKGYTHVYIPKDECDKGYGYQLKEEDKESITSGEILEGTWYIEE